MFGIDDPGIWIPYLLAVLCLFFSAWWGITKWNEDDESDEEAVTEKEFELKEGGGEQ